MAVSVWPKRDEHALEALEVGDAATGRLTGAVGTVLPVEQTSDERDAGELGQLAVELGDRAADAHDVARLDVDAEAVVEDEDAFRGQRVGVGVGVLLLDVEAAELVRRAW